MEQVNRPKPRGEYSGDSHAKSKADQIPFNLCHQGEQIDELYWALIAASKNNTIQERDLEHYTLHEVDLELEDENDKTLLHHMAYRNQVTGIRILLHHGAQVVGKFHFGTRNTPLHQTAKAGHKDAIKTLLTYPQGGPRQFAEDVASEEQIITFFLCLKKLFKEKGENCLHKGFSPHTRRNLFLPYLLPMYRAPIPKLIERVPLQQLKSYAKFVNTKKLVHALVDRHINGVGHILNSVDRGGRTPLRRAMDKGHGKDIQDLLWHDRKSLAAEFGEQITSNYLALLK